MSQAHTGQRALCGPLPNHCLLVHESSCPYFLPYGRQDLHITTYDSLGFLACIHIHSALVLNLHCNKWRKWKNVNFIDCSASVVFTRRRWVGIFALARLAPARRFNWSAKCNPGHKSCRVSRPPVILLQRGRQCHSLGPRALPPPTPHPTSAGAFCRSADGLAPAAGLNCQRFREAPARDELPCEARAITPFSGAAPPSSQSATALR